MSYAHVPALETPNYADPWPDERRPGTPARCDRRAVGASRWTLRGDDPRA